MGELSFLSRTRESTNRPQEDASLRRALDFLQEGIVVLSPDKQVIFASSSAGDLLQVPPTRLHGQPFPYAIEDGGDLEIELNATDVTKISLKLRCKAFEDNGSSGYLVAVSNITDIKKASAAADRANEASKLKSDFLAAMSHEIRNPMTGVIGMTSILLDTALSDEQRSYVQAIKSSGDVLLAILNDVLDLSKIEAGKLTLEESEFRLAGAVEDTIGLFSEQARRKGLLLTNLIEPDVPRTLLGDATRIRQVITNLVSNAVKFTNRGRIVVKAFVMKDDDEHRLRVEVSDTGPGLSPDEATELFKPFQQIRRVMSGIPGGTGLGLALSRHLVEIMNGQIGVESAQGQGSTFWFTIPIKRPGQSNNCAWDLASRTVLVASSDPNFRDLLCHQLKATGASTIQVTPRVALNMARKNARPCDVLILDAPEVGARSRALHTTLIDAVNERGVPTLVLTHDPKTLYVTAKTSHVEVMPKAPLCQSHLCGRVASLMGIGSVERDAERRRHWSATTHRFTSKGLNKSRILVAEDDPVNQAVMKMMLGRLGFDVDVVASGDEAVTAAAKTRYAAILMDYCLPGMDGMAATKLIREAEKETVQKMSIIATTASATSGINEMCKEAGMDGFLAKPFTIEALADAVHGLTELEVESSLDERSLGLLQSLSDGDGPDEDFLSHLIETFVQTAPPLFAQLQSAVSKLDERGVEKLAHRLKGSAGHFGTQRLVLRLEELENKASSGDLTNSQGLLNEAASEFERVKLALKERCQSRVGSLPSIASRGSECRQKTS